MLDRILDFLSKLWSRKPAQEKQEVWIEIDPNPPYVPEGLRLSSYPSGKKVVLSLRWEPKRLTSNNQNFRRLARSYTIRETRDAWRKDEGLFLLLPSSFLRFLMSEQVLIPQDWKEVIRGVATHILFLGTSYRDDFGTEYVVGLSWSLESKKWVVDKYSLDATFRFYHRAAAYVVWES